GLQALLGFNFGAKGERVRSARDAAARLAKRSDVKYLEPKSPPISPPGIAKLVRIYVLGPPRDAAMLGLTERQSEMYGLGAAGGWPIVGQRLCDKQRGPPNRRRCHGPFVSSLAQLTVCQLSQLPTCGVSDK